MLPRWDWPKVGKQGWSCPLSTCGKKLTRFWDDHAPEVLFNLAPNYKRAIQAGKDLWFVLREWRGNDPEGYFGDLGAWAERRMKELGVD